MKKLHEQIRAYIEKVNKADKGQANKNKREVEYQPGDLIWIHLRKEKFHTRRKSKLIARGDGPFRLLAKIEANAYKLELLGDMVV